MPNIQDKWTGIWAQLAEGQVLGKVALHHEQEGATLKLNDTWGHSSH